MFETIEIIKHTNYKSFADRRTLGVTVCKLGNEREDTVLPVQDVVLLMGDVVQLMGEGRYGHDSSPVRKNSI